MNSTNTSPSFSKMRRGNSASEPSSPVSNSPRKVESFWTVEEEDNEHRKNAIAHANYHWSRTCAAEGPAESKDGSADEVAVEAHFFGVELDGLAVNVADLEFFNDPRAGSAEYNGGSDDSVHVKCLKAEHFLDSVPREGLTFGHQDAEKDSDEKVFDEAHILKNEGVE